MRRISIFLIVVLCLSFGSKADAQTAKITHTKGVVTVKDVTDSDFIPAAIGGVLSSRGEIRTGENAECILEFGMEQANKVQIGENSHLIVANLIPGAIVLKSGRVFSLIDDIPAGEEFTLETPVAIAGVRGTGLGASSDKKGATICCFEDQIFIRSIKDEEQVIQEGFCISSDDQGNLRPPFPLSEEQQKAWDAFLALLTSDPDTSDEDFSSETEDTRKEDLRETQDDERLQLQEEEEEEEQEEEEEEEEQEEEEEEEEEEENEY